MGLGRFAAAGLLVPAVLSLAAAALAAVPAEMTEQGRLFDAAGAPLQGTIAITFAVYAAPDGGAPLWTETQPVTLDEGYFSVQLGTSTPIPSGVWNGSTRYLGITVGTDPEMSPRQPVGTVPYAALAGDVTGAIHPTSVTVNGMLVIDSSGNWVGPAAGLAGPAGPAGATGAQGPAGPAGAAGAQGPQGPAGAVGPTGPAGTNGAVGPTGPAGANGTNGAVGPTGPAGTNGTNGAVGPTGPQGSQGTAGATGATGAVGPTGPSGGGGGGGGSLSFVAISADTAAGVNTAYLVNSASLVTVTLPSTCALGNQVMVMGIGSGGFKVQASATSNIMDVYSTSALGASVPSTVLHDTITLTCVVANTTWMINGTTQHYANGIVPVGSGRGYADGTFAASCNAYLNPALPYTYTGFTGDGNYTIRVNNILYTTYCDMTTQGGGWTLVFQDSTANSDNVSFNYMARSATAFGTVSAEKFKIDSFNLAHAKTMFKGTPDVILGSFISAYAVVNKTLDLITGTSDASCGPFQLNNNGCDMASGLTLDYYSYTGASSNLGSYWFGDTQSGTVVYNEYTNERFMWHSANGAAATSGNNPTRVVRQILLK